MKKIILGFMSAAALTAVLTINSCTKDEDACKGVTCQNGGTCVNGSCNCPTGFEGTNCETQSRAKFIGDWQGQDVCTSGTYSNITITNTNQSDTLKISIKNIGGFGATETITGTIVAGNPNQVSFTNQALSGNRTISGTMTVSGNTMTDSYTVTPAVGVADVCNGNYTKL